MTSDQQETIVQLVYELLREHPEKFGSVIDAATVGVKKFAEAQSDNTTKLAYPLLHILDQYKHDAQFRKDLEPFSLKELAERIEPWFRGTQAMNGLKEAANA